MGEFAADTVGVAPPCQFLVQCETKKLYLTKPRMKSLVATTTYHFLGLIFVEAQAILHNTHSHTVRVCRPLSLEPSGVYPQAKIKAFY